MEVSERVAQTVEESGTARITSVRLYAGPIKSRQV